MTFWIATIVVTALVLAALWAAMRAGHRAAHGERAARLAVYRDRLAELEGERAAGTLDDGRYAEARRELEDAAAADLHAASAAVPARGHAGAALYVAVAVAIPAIAFGLYTLLGGQDELQAEQQVAPAAQPRHDIRGMVDGLDARMQQTPDDLEGWMMLGRSRVQLGEYGRGVAAWRQAHRLAADDPTVLANLAEALILDDPSALTGEGGVLIERALEADPENPKSLWYGGLSAAAQGDAAVAEARWRKLLTLNPPAELVPVIENRLDALRGGG